MLIQPQERERATQWSQIVTRAPIIWHTSDSILEIEKITTQSQNLSRCNSVGASDPQRTIEK